MKKIWSRYNFIWYNEDGNLILLKKFSTHLMTITNTKALYYVFMGSKSSLDEVKNFNKNNDLLINKFKIIYFIILNL